MSRASRPSHRQPEEQKRQREDRAPASTSTDMAENQPEVQTFDRHGRRRRRRGEKKKKEQKRTCRDRAGLGQSPKQREPEKNSKQPHRHSEEERTVEEKEGKLL